MQHSQKTPKTPHAGVRFSTEPGTTTSFSGKRNAFVCGEAIAYIQQCQERVTIIKKNLGLCNNISRIYRDASLNAAQDINSLMDKLKKTLERDRVQEPYIQPSGSLIDDSKNREAESELIQRMRALEEQIKRHETYIRTVNETLERTTTLESLSSKDYSGELRDDIKKMHEEIKEMKTSASVATYASVAAGRRAGDNISNSNAIHSIVVSSEDTEKTGETVLNDVRDIIRAREEGLKVDRVRKLRDRKIVIGCNDKKDLEKIKHKLAENGTRLRVDDMTSKDPLIIVKDLMSYNSDEDLMSAIRNQNSHLLQGMSEDQMRMKVLYRRRARNHLQAHVVLRINPTLWKRLTEAGTIHVDLQRVRVYDQTPLIQCTQCLGYGHGKKMCTVQQEVCCHCGGAHKKAECGDFPTGTPPTCVNCGRAGMGDRGEHNAFHPECPVRIKYDRMAREGTSYC